MAEKCEAYRELIEEAAGGAAAGAELRAHLGGCGPCREFRREREALVGLVGGLERVSAPDDFEFRLRARLGARKVNERAPLWPPRLAPGLAWAAVAACLLVGASLYFRTPRPAGQAVAVQDAPPAAAPPAPAVNIPEGAKPPIQIADAHEPPAAARRRNQDAPRGRAVVASLGAAAKRSADKARREVREDSFGVRGASVIEGGVGYVSQQGATRTEQTAVPLRTSPETLRVVLRDERGGAYVLPMRSFSFGAQAPVGGAVRTTRASYKEKGGVW
ncbi:MAG TPA: hypothetical protein VG148_01605 [Pyrinomonadaceae bacterium]|nr:hypothetical protein [Pyrinomonadaceae bacterium]